MTHLNGFSKMDDHLIDHEDVVSDAIWAAIGDLYLEEDIRIDHDSFFEEIHGRSKRLRVELAFKILGAKDREEFEEMVHDLYTLCT